MWICGKKHRWTHSESFISDDCWWTENQRHDYRWNVAYSKAYSKVHAAEPRQEKMRLLLDVLDSGGAVVKGEFCRLLKENEHYLVDELESGPRRPQKYWEKIRGT